MLKYTDITQNTYVQIWTVTEIMAREVWNFDSCYTLIDYQIHIKTYYRRRDDAVSILTQAREWIAGESWFDSLPEQESSINFEFHCFTVHFSIQ